uniref:Uncharacterized protein n=1 Tax=Cannabis sativa TaxID=3483 RepID=A0A803QSL7_CANSA
MMARRRKPHLFGPTPRPSSGSAPLSVRRSSWFDRPGWRRTVRGRGPEVEELDEVRPGVLSEAGTERKRLEPQSGEYNEVWAVSRRQRRPVERGLRRRRLVGAVSHRRR